MKWKDVRHETGTRRYIRVKEKENGKLAYSGLAKRVRKAQSSIDNEKGPLKRDLETPQN